MNEHDTIRLIQENPTIMIRPVLMKDDLIVIGFKEDEYEAAVL